MLVLSRKVLQKAFFNRVISHSHEKCGGTYVLSGEHMGHVVMAGLDKATLSMYCYLLASRSPDMPQSRCFLRLYAG